MMYTMCWTVGYVILNENEIKLKSGIDTCHLLAHWTCIWWRIIMSPDLCSISATRLGETKRKDWGMSPESASQRVAQVSGRGSLVRNDWWINKYNLSWWILTLCPQFLQSKGTILLLNTCVHMGRLGHMVKRSLSSFRFGYVSVETSGSADE